MPRVKRGPKRRQKRKKVLAQAKGYFQAKSKLYKRAKEAVDRSQKFAYIGRRLKKRDFRGLWIIRISAGARQHGLSYSRLIHGLKLAAIDLNRKMLADMAVRDAEGFAKLAERAKAALAGAPIPMDVYEKPAAPVETKPAAVEPAEKPPEKAAEKPAEKPAAPVKEEVPAAEKAPETKAAKPPKKPAAAEEKAQEEKPAPKKAAAAKKEATTKPAATKKEAEAAAKPAVAKKKAAPAKKAPAAKKEPAEAAQEKPKTAKKAAAPKAAAKKSEDTEKKPAAKKRAPKKKSDS